MTVWAYELVRINGAGFSSISYLTIADDDRGLTSQEADATYVLDGVTLAAAPVVDVGVADYIWIDGQAAQTVSMHFSIGVVDYYMLPAGHPGDVIEAITGFNSFGAVGNINYTSYGAVIDDGAQYRGDALVQTFNLSGVLQTTDIQSVAVLDDDNRIEFDGTNGAPLSETDGQAVAVMGNGADVSFNTTDAGAGDTLMVLVTVDYTGTAGAGSFEAIRYGFNFGSERYVYYIPLKGSVDLSTVTAVTGETLLATSLDGRHYSEFGLGPARDKQVGDSLDNQMVGDLPHDRFLGKGGNDTLIGGNGSDQLQGGGGGDRVYGGAHDDDLFGDGGADKIYAGIGDDSADGGSGSDVIDGGWGDDLLFGGTQADTLNGEDGKDTLDGGTGADTLTGGNAADELSGGGNADDLQGGAGADRLDGGSGADLLTGGSGADTFIFNTDGAIDTILDFADGTDLIDVGVAFATLTIVTFAVGEVHVTHSGEVLVVQDSAGLLTAADLTAADFL